MSATQASFSQRSLAINLILHSRRVFQTHDPASSGVSAFGVQLSLSWPFCNHAARKNVMHKLIVVALPSAGYCKQTEHVPVVNVIAATINIVMAFIIRVMSEATFM